MTVSCCPYCGSTKWLVRSPGKPSRVDDESRYRCQAIGCRRRFDELAEREDESPDELQGNHTHGLAGDLDELDPDEVTIR